MQCSYYALFSSNILHSLFIYLLHLKIAFWLTLHLFDTFGVRLQVPCKRQRSVISLGFLRNIFFIKKVLVLPHNYFASRRRVRSNYGNPLQW